jgi:predicted amidohydrolase YtcJ
MPDLLFHGGPIYTLDPAQPRAEALLVRGDRIVIPGLIDAHIHLLWTGLGRMNVDLEGVTSLDAALAKIEQHAQTLPEGAWIRGHGWNHARWDNRWPTAVDLDRVTAGRPSLLSRKDGHALWLNTLALQRAGIDRDTVSPPGGTIQHDEHGEPTGVLFENANNLAYRVVPEPTWEERRVALRGIIAECNRRGLTGLHIPEGPDCLALLRELRDRDELNIRTLWHIPYAQLDHAIGLGIRSGLGDEWVRIGGVKIFSDGSLGSMTCHMLEPFTGSTDNYGLSTIGVGELRDAVQRADRAGIAVTIHAIGDRANRTVLDAIANSVEHRAQQGVPPTNMLWGPALPHRIEHVQHLAPSDVGRFAQLGVIASMQPIHTTSDHEVAERLLGAERAAWGYAFRPLLAAGATLAFGSDAPVETFDPWAGIHAAVTRQRVDGQPEGGWHPEHRLSLEEALAAYVVGPAKASGELGIKGSLRVGALADLVVTSSDPFAADPQQLWQQGVDLTVVGGKIIK